MIVQGHHLWPLSLIVLAWVFASMAIPIRYLDSEFSIITQTFFRILIAFLMSYCFFKKAIRMNIIKIIPRKEWVILSVRAVLTYCLGVTLFSYAVVETKISNASFIQALPWVAIFWWTLLKEKFSKEDGFFVFLACLGSLLIGIKDLRELGSFGKGEIFAVFASIAFSLSYIMRRWQWESLNNKELTFLQLGIGSIFLFVLMFISGENMADINIVTNWFIVLLLLISGFLNVANLWLTNYGFKNTRAVTANNILSMEGIFSIFLGFFFFQELPNGQEFFGSILIIISVILINLRRKN